MKLLFTIVMTILMLQQLLPVSHWPEGSEAAHAALCDEAEEDALLKKSADAKADAKLWAEGYPDLNHALDAVVNFSRLTATYLTCPPLEYSTPPPDAC